MDILGSPQPLLQILNLSKDASVVDILTELGRQTEQAELQGNSYRSVQLQQSLAAFDFSPHQH
jgi:hypothetical protein